MNRKVETQAQMMVLTEPGNSDPTAAIEFARLIEEAKPEAEKRVRLRFQRLLEALESGNDVKESLAAFVKGMNLASLMRRSGSE